mmetsp:Transcript_24865/g.36445  ORF Transcript_24865/g.36445 Transcript_24865/m.36445 type:complete len:142 (-) Transcript_24865:591-1016(-)
MEPENELNAIDKRVKLVKDKSRSDNVLFKSLFERYRDSKLAMSSMDSSSMCERSNVRSLLAAAIPVKGILTAFPSKTRDSSSVIPSNTESDGKVPVKPTDRREIPFTNPSLEQRIPAHEHKLTFSFIQFWFEGQFSPLQDV